MLGALIIVFREVIEAGIIVGIVLAVTRGVRGAPVDGRRRACGHRRRAAGRGFRRQLAGAMAGAGRSCSTRRPRPRGGMLAWHNIWMARHGRELARDSPEVGRDVRAAIGAPRAGGRRRRGGHPRRLRGRAVFIGILISGELGSMSSPAVSRALAWRAGQPPDLLWAGDHSAPKAVRDHPALVTLLAGGLAAQSAAFLQQAGVVTALSRTLWDTSGILPDNGLFGRVLHTLIGYSDQPSALQAVAYLGTIFTIVIATKLAAPAPRGVTAMGTPAE